MKINKFVENILKEDTTSTNKYGLTAEEVKNISQFVKTLESIRHEIFKLITTEEDTFEKNNQKDKISKGLLNCSDELDNIRNLIIKNDWKK